MEVSCSALRRLFIFVFFHFQHDVFCLLVDRIMAELALTSTFSLLMNFLERLMLGGLISRNEVEWVLG
jgi:hypothetical protein